MKTLKLRFNKAAIASIDGAEGHSITLLDAISGQLGQVMDIEVILNVDSLRRPAIPFIDATKVGEDTPAPEAAAATTAVVAKSKAAKASNEPIVHRINKDTKIATMVKCLTKVKKVKDGWEYAGITRSALAEEMGQTENSPTAYLYSYPKKFGCTLESEVRSDNLRYYWMAIPENVTFEYV